ncbi:hypothetical protein [Streptomyces sp. NPDC097640]
MSDVARSGYGAPRDRPPSARTVRHAWLSEAAGGAGRQPWVRLDK